MTKATPNHEDVQPAAALRALAVVLAPLVAAELRAIRGAPDELVNDATPGLGMSPRKIRTLAKAGAFKAEKRGRRWFFYRGDFEAHLAPERSRAVVTHGAPPAVNDPPDRVAELARSLGVRIGGVR